MRSEVGNRLLRLLRLEVSSRRKEREHERSSAYCKNAYAAHRHRELLVLRDWACLTEIGVLRQHNCNTREPQRYNLADDKASEMPGQSSRIRGIADSHASYPYW